MKKALIISIIIFVAACIVFGVSVAATGLREKNFSLKIGIGEMFGGNALSAGEEINKSFSEEINNIELGVSEADVKITLADVDEASVKFRTVTGGNTFETYVDGDTLKIKEEGMFISFITWDFSDKEAILEIVLPEKEYEDVVVGSASGYIEIENLICDKFVSVTTSGDTDYNIFANEIDIFTTSGKVSAENCTDRKAEKLVIGSTSGDHIIKGFGSEEFEIYTVSGTIKVEELSGEGKFIITSGEVTADFAEWTDNISVDAVSGEVELILPENAGVIVDLDAVSGGVQVELDSEKGSGNATISGESNTGVLGGENVHNVSVDLVSGDVKIRN